MREHDVPEVEDVVRITLSKCGEYFATIDARHWPLVSRWRWSLHHCGKGKLYARAERDPDTGEKVRIYMHRLIAQEVLGEAPTKKHVVDHRDGDGLNNRETNLRWLDGYENRWVYARHKCENPAHA